jgi:hypothetical protein
LSHIIIVTDNKIHVQSLEVFSEGKRCLLTDWWLVFGHLKLGIFLGGFGVKTAKMLQAEKFLGGKN